MKRLRTPSISAIVLLALAAPGFAAAPHKQPVERYENLWKNSPFTNPEIIIVTPPPAPNPVEDYTLASLCRIEGGWHVVLLSKKDRTERIRLQPHSVNALGLEVIGVEQPNDRKSARVEIQAGGITGWVEFEPQFLAIRQAGARSTPVRQYPAAQLQSQPRIRRVPVPPKDENEEKNRK